MRFEHASTIAVSPGHVRGVLEDVPLVVSCIPGASVTERLAEDRYAGQVGVRHGELGITFRGSMSVEERSADRLRISATGAGGDHLTVLSNVEALVSPDAAGTKLALAVEIDFSGGLAGFAGSAACAVCPALLRTFAGNLEQKALAAAGATTT